MPARRQSQEDVSSYLVDLDDKERVGEVGVVDKDVFVFDVPTSRDFLEDARLSACQGLEGTAQLGVFDQSVGLQVLERYLVHTVVVLEQHQSLKRQFQMLALLAFSSSFL